MLFFIFLLTLCHPTMAQAIKAGNLPIDVEPVYPTNQTNTQSGFFNVALRSGEQTTLGLKLTNLSTQPQTLVVKPISVTTDSSGNLFYGAPDLIQDKSAVLPFAKVTTKRQTIKLAPKATQNIVFPVTIPRNSNFSGSILGALYITSPTNDRQNLKNQHKGKVQFLDLYTLSVGVWLRVNDYQKVQPNFRLGKITPMVQGTTPTLMIRLQNFKPTVIQNHQMTLTARVYSQTSNKVILQKHLPGVSFAPNSTMALPLAFTLRQLPAGNYTAKIDLKYHNKIWHLQRNFTITANKWNHLFQSKKKSYRWLWIVLIVGFLLLNIVFSGYLYRRERRKR